MGMARHLIFDRKKISVKLKAHINAKASHFYYLKSCRYRDLRSGYAIFDLAVHIYATMG